MDKTKNLKLYIELVPKTCWYENLRKVLSKAEWDRIRKQTYSEVGNKCSICGAEGRLNCHEIWEYDDKNNTQILRGFQALCDNCHNIKHIGFVNVQINKGIWSKDVMDNLAKHFMKVNGCSMTTFKQHVEEAFNTWQERSKKNWTTDLGKFKKNPLQKTLF